MRTSLTLLKEMKYACRTSKDFASRESFRLVENRLKAIQNPLLTIGAKITLHSFIHFCLFTTQGPHRNKSLRGPNASVTPLGIPQSLSCSHDLARSIKYRNLERIKVQAIQFGEILSHRYRGFSHITGRTSH